MHNFLTKERFNVAVRSILVLTLGLFRLAVWGKPQGPFTGFILQFLTSIINLYQVGFPHHHILKEEWGALVNYVHVLMMKLKY